MSMNFTRASTTRQVSFGPFRLLPYQRLLMERDEPVHLGSRALDILTVLVERPGELVTRAELMRRAWPDTVVVPANLTVHVAALRRALRDGQEGRRYLLTVPGRGYRFVAPVAFIDEPSAAVQRVPQPPPAHGLPPLFGRPIGRGEVIDEICEQSSLPPLLTLVGPGGAGKSTVAIAAVERLIDRHAQAVQYVDLAAAADPRCILDSMAAALNVGDRPLLFVLDNCRRTADAAAAAQLLRSAPGIRILATSREPLGIDGERLLRLPLLAIPTASGGITAAEAMRFAAVRLFVDRVEATLGEFELTDPDAALVADICRRLDGLPLAIKLAAHRIDSTGLQGIARGVDDILDVSMPSAWAVPARHRSLRASMDWSRAQLTNAEQTLFRRLAVFADHFTLAAAQAVAAGGAIGQAEIPDIVASLARKSLLVADLRDAEPRFGLMHTTRAYALAKLLEANERRELQRRHAEHYRGALENAMPEGTSLAPSRMLSEIDNVRMALTWAFSREGDPGIGMAIALASIPLWNHRSGGYPVSQLDLPGYRALRFPSAAANAA
jgi:predicted ATPase/DNA-binding winged helix-turn-helix (wHTH) protein